ncbi:tetratricopeptide repeat protein [Bradyrhizobium canariense]|nr:tetratricopeptide repeat protein [Bradyrhizobium canariense]
MGELDRAIADYDRVIELNHKAGLPTAAAVSSMLKRATMIAPSPITTR